MAPWLFLRELFCLDSDLRPLHGSASRKRHCDFLSRGPLRATGYAHHPYSVKNPPDVGEKAKTAFEARLKTPAMQDARADYRPFDDPIPPDVHDLDLITFLFYYHDTVYMNVDRAAMDRKMFAALRPGGVLVIADHSALPGQGTSVVKTLHRIEEPALRQELEAAGFKVVDEGNFWRNPNDSHDFPSYKPVMPVDNFVLKFQKPM